MISSNHGDHRNTFVVTTTIRVPTFLRDICRNALEHGHSGVTYLIIGDTKTPVEASNFCKSLAQELGARIEFLDIQDQEAAVAGYPELSRMMPLNSASRKMIGNFIAYLRGCDSVVMLDDDNLFHTGDFIGQHNIVGKQMALDLIKTGSGWFCVAAAMIEEHGIPFYPRGYPWSQRIPDSLVATKEKSPANVVVNQGFVLGDPDIDAISRLFWPIRVTGMNPEFEPHFGLRPGTWCSFNNQNTALSREIVPAYFTPPKTGRNADIWASYVICRLAEHMGGTISFGTPLVRQVRNPHSLWRDLDDELLNNKATDAFVSLLRSIELTAPTYRDALAELLHRSLAELPNHDDLPELELASMRDFFFEYQVWHGLFDQLV